MSGDIPWEARDQQPFAPDMDELENQYAALHARYARLCCGLIRGLSPQRRRELLEEGVRAARDQVEVLREDACQLRVAEPVTRRYVEAVTIHCSN